MYRPTHAKFHVSSLSRSRDTSESRNLNVCHVTPPWPIWPSFSWLSLGPPALYMHTKFQVCSFSCFWDMQWVHNYQNFPPPCGDQDSRLTQCSLSPRVFTPIRSVIFAHWSGLEPRNRQTYRLTDRQTDTGIIGNNSLHLMHSMLVSK